MTGINEIRDVFTAMFLIIARAENIVVKVIFPACMEKCDRPV